MTPQPALHRDSRSGIALVIVLSLMAALMILAVSFAVSMRTEHKAAKMSGTQIQAIQMCYYGLAQALEHIQADAVTSMWWVATAGPLSPPISGTTPQGWYYPAWSNHCIHSGMRADANGDLATWFPDDRAVRFIPQALFGPKETVHTLNNETNRDVCTGRTVRFVDVDAPTANGRMVGRYAYMVVDCSGLVDVNGNHELDPDRGRTQPRGPGTNVCEIAFTNALDPVFRLQGATNIHNARVGYGGYRHQRFGRVESLEDLRTVAYGGFDNLNNAPFRTFSDPSPNSTNNINYPRNLTTYTRYPEGYGVIASDLFDLSGTAAEIGASGAALVDVFQARYGMTAERATWLTRNLIDYLDDDYIVGGINGGSDPTGPNADSICTEPVPMLQRLDIGTRFATTNDLDITLFVETFFPFLYTSNALAPPNIEMTIAYELDGGDYAPVTNGWTEVIPAGKFQWVRGIPSTAPPAGQFWQAIRTFRHTAPGAMPVLPTALVIKDFSIKLAGQNIVVDRVKCDDPANPPRFPRSEIIQDYSSEAQFVSWQAVDPRINWILKGTSTQWTNTFPKRAGSVGGRRNILLPESASTREKGEWAAYVANGRLYAVGELGYLLHDARRPWRTISFFCETADDTNDYMNVWEHFWLNPKGTKYGLVNISSRITNALATAFHGCPFEAAPGILAGQSGDDYRLAAPGAAWIAGEIINNRPGQGYTNLAALGGATTNMVGLPGLTTLTSKPITRNSSWMGREAILRNTEGLLGTRNNTFIVLVLGQGATKLNDPESNSPVVRRTAGQRAIALVWRDPFAPPSAPKHFVRWIRWQDDWVGDVSDQF